ncbi:carbonic anhydrase [soil metagenome]
MDASRRSWLARRGASLLGAALATLATSSLAGTAPGAAFRHGTAMTADEALRRLKRGNGLYISGTPLDAETGHTRRNELARRQAPYAIVLCCSDSRVPPELLFRAGLGELFVVRNAGNQLDDAALGSIEYGVAFLGAPLIVVLGHEGCGAVEAAVDVVATNKLYPGHIGKLIEPIVPAVLEARTQPGALMENAVRENVKRTVARLKNLPEPLLHRPQVAGALKVVGARYDLHDGEVEFIV